MELNIHEIIEHDGIKNLKHLDRRQEYDPTYQGYFALDGFDQRQLKGHRPGTKPATWQRIEIKDFFETF